MTSALKPCPFCGGEPDEYEGDYGNGICCTGCGAMVGEPIHMDYRVTERVSIEQAIEAWNTRAERTCKNLKQPGYNYMKCSACGEKAYQGDRQYSYCPWCGAEVVEP